MSNAISLFQEEIRRHGMEPPASIEPGHFHRFPGRGKGSGNNAGWCKLFEDGRGGCFGDWSSDLSVLWLNNASQHFDVDAAQDRRVIQAARELREARTKERHAEAARRASWMWSAAEPIDPDFPYIARKGITPYAARMYDNRIVLPIRDLTGALTSLQFIDADGHKTLLSGGRKASCVVPVKVELTLPYELGGPPIDPEMDPERVLICEGWATACTLAELYPGAAILAAIDCGNLVAAATAGFLRWPAAQFTICGDDDRQTEGNPGRTKAIAAAQAIGAEVQFPDWPNSAPAHLTDFNDLEMWLAGLDSQT